ncbi:NRAMP family divalent metal transporter [Allofustis seminis]|uniref:NRAMP family divalent metal transporter n=1 Tax=Allofustis seminis TaxID=166939 RepID=UPI0003766A78|nr:divalent metal cation transporter [Allofustis seminis]
MKEKKSFMDRIKNMGPAAIVTSAFIGPGTITTTTLAGVDYEYQLLWAVLFSGVALISLMQMTSRISIISQKDITFATIEALGNKPGIRKMIIALVTLTLFVTGFGFEAGNLIGGSLGFADLFNLPQWVAALVLGGAAFYAVVIGTAKTLEKLMSLFVGLMGLLFFVTMILVQPDYGAVLQGFVTPSVPDGSIVNVISLIGTTLIGINILIHSLSTAEKWDDPAHLGDASFDTYFNVGIGLIITAAIVIAAGTVLYGTGTEVTSPIVFSQMLQPVLGDFARWIGDLGITSAGLSSAIATPLILKEVVPHVLGWERNGIKARIAGGSAVVFGTVLAALGQSPVQIIIFASALSGIFLPIIAIMVMISANSEKLMGKYKNNILQNVVGGFATIITLILGIRSILNFLSNF